MRRAVFTATDLRNVSFRNADLREASFDRCDLRKADFDGANLAGILVDTSVVGSVSKEFAEALAAIDKPEPSPSAPIRLGTRRSGTEWEFGPSR